jgi:hypothetical protein
MPGSRGAYKPNAVATAAGAHTERGGTAEERNPEMRHELEHHRGSIADSSLSRGRENE